MKTEKEIQYGIRLAESALARVDKLTEKMSKPGMRVIRAQVIRLAVFYGLERLEAEQATPRTKK